MTMEYATITGTIVVPGTTTGIPGELRAYPRTTNGVLTFPAENVTTIGPAVAEVAADGALTPDLQIPTDVPEGLVWRLVFHPKGLGNLPVRLGDYPITEDADVADLVPIEGTVFGGFTDHGDVSGTLEVTAGSHEFDLTGDLEVTVVGTGDVTLHVHGPGTVTVAGTDFDIDDDEVIIIITSPRGVQTAYLAGGGGGVTDTTPPSAVTDLSATGGAGEIVLDWSAATDAESTVFYRYRAWLTSGGASGAWTTTTATAATITGLAAGAYTAEVYAYSAGGSTTPDTATATVTAPLVLDFEDTFSRGPSNLSASPNPDLGSPWGGASMSSATITAGGQLQITSGVFPVATRSVAARKVAATITTGSGGTQYSFGADDDVSVALNPAGRVFVGGLAGVTYNVTGGSLSYTTNGYLTVGTHEVTIELDGSTAIIYVDDVRVIEGAYVQATSGFNITLGSSDGGSATAGSIDNVRVWH